MSNDDFTFRSSGDSVPSAGSRLTSRSHGRQFASSMTSKPKSWKHCVLCAPPAQRGTNARVPALIAGSTLITVFTTRSSICSHADAARASPKSRATCRLSAASDHLLPDASSSASTLGTYCCECLLRDEFVKCMHLRRWAPREGLSRGFRGSGRAVRCAAGSREPALDLIDRVRLGREAR